MLDELLKSAKEDGVIMCVAAGNTNSTVNNWEISDVEGVSYPADSSDVITVSGLMREGWNGGDSRQDCCRYGRV